MTNTTKEQRVQAIKSAIQRGGGIMSFSEGMGVTHQAVYNWLKRGYVPPAKVLVIEATLGIPRALLLNPALVALLQPQDEPAVI